MKTFVRTFLLTASFLALGCVPALADNLIVNGGFETGDFTGYDLANIGATSVSSFGFGPYVPHDGAFFAALGNVGNDAQIGQTFSDVSGATYLLSFFLASDGATPNDFSTWIDGVPVMGENDIPASDYVGYSFAFTGTGSDTITFLSRNDPSYLSLDDISVSTADSPVPEPSSLVCLGTGLVAITGLARRRFTRA